MPKVSVIIPVYNVEKYLRQTLDSVINQTLKNIEIICVDDGSTDSSTDILQEYAAMDKRITVIRQSNQGAAMARNLGIKQVHGKYLYFMDSDDICHKDMLRLAVDAAEMNDADIVVFKAGTFINTPSEYTVMNDCIGKYCSKGIDNVNAKTIADDVFNSFLVQAWNKLYRKSFVGKHSLKFQELRRTNDLFFTCKSLVCAETISLIDRVLFFHREGISTSLQANTDKSPLDFYYALLEIKRFLVSTRCYDLYMTSFNKLAADILFYNLHRLKKSMAREQVVDMLLAEGLEALNFKTDTISVRKVGLLSYLQLWGLEHKLGSNCVDRLYQLHKVSQYVKRTGVVNTLDKLLKKRNKY